jgi:ribonuclease E
MFPNIRLMVVAVLAAIAGIGSGLGLFATFRVNHEPLARLAEGSPPLQLAFDNLALGLDARVPLEARLPVNDAAKAISVPVIIATPSLAAPSLATPSLVTPSPAAEQMGADSAGAGDSSVQQASADAGATDQGNTGSLAVAAPAEQSSVTPEAIAPNQQEAVAAAQDQQPAVSAATAPTAEQTAAITTAAEDQQPAAKPSQSGESKAAKPAVKASRSAAQALRASKTVHLRRPLATVAAQPAYQYSQPTYSQPTYTWTDGTAQASRSVKRVQIKRHRTAKKTAPPAAQSSPSAATAGLSGTQY